jgi:hypothetical protein
MWKYKTETIIILNNSENSLDDELNKFGEENWEVYSVESEPYYDPKLKIGSKYITAGIKYKVRLKLKYYDD